MKRLVLLLSLLLISFNTNSTAQDDITDSAVQDLVNAIVGHGANVLVSKLPQGISIEFPETIKVLGTLEFDGPKSGGGPMPPFPMLRSNTPTPPIPHAPYRAFEIVLSSDMTFAELNILFDDILKASGYSFISDNLLARQGPPQWGFVQTIEEEPQQIDRSYCNDSYQLWVSGHQNQFPSSSPLPQTRLRMYVGLMPIPTACQVQVSGMEEQDASSIVEPQPVGPQLITPSSSPQHLRKGIGDLPKLVLQPPQDSEVVSISFPSRFPDIYLGARLTFTDNIPASWLNRTLIATSQSNETLHDFYSKQLRKQDWTMLRSGVNTPFVWSEWEASSPDGTKWIGVLQFTTDLHFKSGASMITLQLFEKP